MFAVLPEFTPGDPHSLWYKSSRAPPPPQPTPNLRDAYQQGGALPPQGAGANHPRPRPQAIERTVLGRLAADEQYMQLRKHNVQNFGSAWLKPPGIPKTLQQICEEKREQEEHQEALRREQLAQELAEAEAAAAGQDEAMMEDDVQLDRAQDLDDEIPDADDRFALDEVNDDDDDEEHDDDDGYDDNGDASSDAEGASEEVLREHRQTNLLEAGMRMNDDAFREALVRGDLYGPDMYDEEADPDDPSQGPLIDEDDFAAPDASINMDVNLDDEIPDADAGGYEHTDSEAGLSSSSSGASDSDDYAGAQHLSFESRARPLRARPSPTLRRRVSLANPPTSLDLSSLSQDENSFADISPAQGQRARQG